MNYFLTTTNGFDGKYYVYRPIEWCRCPFCYVWYDSQTIHFCYEIKHYEPPYFYITKSPMKKDRVEKERSDNDW